MALDLRLRRIDVKAEGATGNGTTDDTAAIQAALNAVPSSGGEVHFPPGNYRVTAPLIPKSATLITGTHVPRYMGSAGNAVGASSCRVFVGAGFVGAALIAPAASTRGLGFRNICLDGMQVAGGMHGISNPAPSGELGWTLESLQIVGFTGSGWHGSMHVAVWNLVHISHCHGWGMLVDGGHKFVDSKLSGIFIYFNRTGGVNFDTTGPVGFVEWVNTRIERSGGNHTNVQAPHNINAPGLRIRAMQNCNFVNLSTDANSGEGLDLVIGTGLAGKVVDLSFTNSTFKRDGYGDGSGAESTAVRLVGAANEGSSVVQHVTFTNCRTLPGKADDTGAWPALNHPTRGLTMDNCYYVDWVSGRVQGRTSSYLFPNGQTGIFRCTLIDSFNRILMVGGKRIFDPGAITGAAIT